MALHMCDNLGWLTGCAYNILLWEPDQLEILPIGPNSHPNVFIIHELRV